MATSKCSFLFLFGDRIQRQERSIKPVFAFIYSLFRPEVDLKKTQAGGDDSVQYESVVGLRPNEEDAANEEPVQESDDSESDGEEEEEDSPKGFVSSRRPRNEDKEDKKLRKQAVKDSKADKRKEKVKKHVKKRKDQSGKKAVIK